MVALIFKARALPCRTGRIDAKLSPKARSGGYTVIQNCKGIGYGGGNAWLPAPWMYVPAEWGVRGVWGRETVTT